MKSLKIFLGVSLVLTMAIGGSAQQTDTRKWRNRLLQKYQYMKLETDLLPRTIFARETDNVKHRYLCFTYKLSNVGEKPFVLRPAFELRTDTEKVYPEASREDVRKEVSAKNGREYLSTLQIIKKLAEENEDGRPSFEPEDLLYGVAIFPPIDPAADLLEIYAYGLTDSFKIEEREGKRVPMVEARVVTFHRPGDRHHPDRNMSLAEEDWVYVDVHLTKVDPKLLPKAW